MSVASVKVPAVIVSGVISLVIGLGCGLLIGRNTAATADKPVAVAPPENEEKAKQGGDGGRQGVDGPKQAGGAKGGKGTPGPKGGGQQAKTQLTQLIAKLDLLTHKPPLPLTAEQKMKMKSLLADIDAAEDMSQDDAKTRLDALLAVLEENKLTVQAAGFPWPGAVAPPQSKQTPNPFKSGPASIEVIHLKALRDHLDAK